MKTVQGQIDKITDELLMHEHTLLKDIKSPGYAVCQDAEFLR